MIRCIFDYASNYLKDLVIRFRVINNVLHESATGTCRTSPELSFQSLGFLKF